MSESSSKKIDIHTRLLAVFMIFALIVAVWGLSTLDLSSLTSIERPGILIFAIVSQLLGSGIFILAWHLNLKQNGIASLSFNESILHSGIAFVGKYMPGKVSGLIMRGIEIYKQNPSTTLIVKATTIEQVTVIHSGLLICLILWALDAEPQMALLYWLLALASLLVVFFPRLLLLTVGKLSSRYPVISERLSVFEQGFRKPYFTVMTLMMAIWLLTALSLLLCLRSFSVTVPFENMVLITTLSFLSGFFAFMLPAGIGAREAALVFLLSPFCNPLTAITVATLHRIITVTLDLAIGSYALHKVAQREA